MSVKTEPKPPPSREKRAVLVRMPVPLLLRIDQAARRAFIDRSSWMKLACQEALASDTGEETPDGKRRLD